MPGAVGIRLGVDWGQFLCPGLQGRGPGRTPPSQVWGFPALCSPVSIRMGLAFPPQFLSSP